MVRCSGPIPEVGLYIWLSVPQGIDTGPDGPLFARCLERGVLYVPGAYAYAEGSGIGTATAPKNHAQLCFGVPSEAELAEGQASFLGGSRIVLNPVA